MNDTEDRDDVGLRPKDASSEVFGGILLLGKTHGDEECVQETSSLNELQVDLSL